MVAPTDATCLIAGFSSASIVSALVGSGLVNERRAAWRIGLLFAARLLLGVSLLGTALVVAEAIEVMQSGGWIRRTALFPLFFHAVPLQIVATATAASRHPRARFIAGILFVVLLGGLGYFVQVASNYFVSMCDYGSAEMARDAVLEESVLALDQARVLCLLLGAAALARTLRSKSTSKRSGARASLGAIGVFALGLVAFALARPYARDAHRPLKFLYGALVTDPGLQTPPTEPSDEHAWGAFYLALDSAGASLDGEELRGPEDLQAYLRIYHLEHPTTRSRCVILADPSTPRAAVETWLTALREGGALLFAGSYGDHFHESETLGRIHRGRVATWRLDAHPESPGATWGELAHRTAVPAALPYPWD